MALVGTLVHHLSASVRAEATRMFWEIAGTHGIRPEVHYPVPEFATLAGATGSIACPGPWLLPERGSTTASRAPGRPTSSCSPPPGNVFTLRTAKLRHPDTCPLTVPHTIPWHGHHGPHHPFPDNDDPWPAGVRMCPNQCADDHLHYCRPEQSPTDHPRWRYTLVYLFHTTGTPEPRLRLVHLTRAKQDTHTGPRVTSDVLHLHVGDYRRQGSLSPPAEGAAYNPPAGLFFLGMAVSRPKCNNKLSSVLGGWQ